MSVQECDNVSADGNNMDNKNENETSNQVVAESESNSNNSQLCRSKRNVHFYHKILIVSIPFPPDVDCNLVLPPEEAHRNNTVIRSRQRKIVVQANKKWKEVYGSVSPSVRNKIRLARRISNTKRRSHLGSKISISPREGKNGIKKKKKQIVQEDLFNAKPASSSTLSENCSSSSGDAIFTFNDDGDKNNKQVDAAHEQECNDDLGQTREKITQRGRRKDSLAPNRQRRRLSSSKNSKSKNKNNQVDKKRVYASPDETKVFVHHRYGTRAALRRRRDSIIACRRSSSSSSSIPVAPLPPCLEETQENNDASFLKTNENNKQPSLCTDSASKAVEAGTVSKRRGPSKRDKWTKRLTKDTETFRINDETKPLSHLVSTASAVNVVARAPSKRDKWTKGWANEAETFFDEGDDKSNSNVVGAGVLKRDKWTKAWRNDDESSCMGENPIDSSIVCRAPSKRDKWTKGWTDTQLSQSKVVANNSGRAERRPHKNTPRKPRHSILSPRQEPNAPPTISTRAKRYAARTARKSMGI